MLRVYLKLVLMFIIIILTFAVVGTLRLSNRMRVYSGAVIQQCYKALAAVSGLRIELRGAPETRRPLLLLSNHISYMDIIALGSLAPVIFTPKSEIAAWPLIGTACRLSDCVFIDRKVSKTSENLHSLHEALMGDRPLLLFGEGTTSDGKRLLPIRSSYLQILEGEGNVHIQPVLISYTRTNNLPVDSSDRHKIAWYGDMELWPHAKTLLQFRTITAVVQFLPVVDTSQFSSRKEIAAQCSVMLEQAYQTRAER